MNGAGYRQTPFIYLEDLPSGARKLRFTKIGQRFFRILNALLRSLHGLRYTLACIGHGLAGKIGYGIGDLAIH